MRSVPQLVLLNGPPAAGKSTLAARWVQGRELGLDLDIDAIRNWLGAWPEPDSAWIAARKLAMAMARVHLSDGHDVIVPQFLMFDGYLLQLELLAGEVGAEFVEVALIVRREDMMDAFAQRSADPENQQHRDAQATVERLGGIDVLGEQYDRFMRLLDMRPDTRRVDVIRGDVDTTFARLASAIAGRT